jgi:hypothetical protein
MLRGSGVVRLCAIRTLHDRLPLNDGRAKAMADTSSGLSAGWVTALTAVMASESAIVALVG